ncbi:hypothetical protein L208DRAFT_1283603, partial [Tricholoma matsutake]
LPGSQHNSTAWSATRVPQEHNRLMQDGEWVWGDSAYPLKDWCQAPYKKPENETEKNTTHNYYVSKVHIQSEHCMGFLKGCWSSLWGLHTCINDEKGLQYAALWVTACIHLHAFALNHKDMQFVNRDTFYKKGQRIAKKERQDRVTQGKN